MTAHATPEQPGPEPADAPPAEATDPHRSAAGTPSSRPSPPVWSAEEARDAWSEERADGPAEDVIAGADEWLQGPVEPRPGPAADADEPPTDELPLAEPSADEHHLDTPTDSGVEPDHDPESGEHWQVVEQSPARAPVDAGTAMAAPPSATPSTVASSTAAAPSTAVPVTVMPPVAGPGAPAAQAAVAPAVPGPDPEPPARTGGTLAATLELLAPHLRPQRPALLTGVIALVLGAVSLALAPLALRVGLDAAGGTGGADPSAALPAALGLGAMALIGVGLRALSATALDGAASRAATALRSRLLHHLHRLGPGRDIEDLEGAATPLVEDVASLRDLVGRAGPRLLGAVTALVTMLVTVLVIAPALAPVPLVAAVLASVVSVLAGRSGSRREAAERTDAAALADTAQELLAATRTVQSYGLEDRAAGTLAEIGARAARSRSAARRVRVFGLAAHALVGAAGAVAVLLLAGERPGGASAGALAVVLVATLAAVPLASAVVRARSRIAAAVTAAAGLSDLLSRTAAIGEPPRTQGVGRLCGEVVFSAISAGSERGPRFDGVSVVIPAGQRVALMDRGGAESSALLSYLLRFDQPETGRVLLDRYDTRSLSLADLRGALAVVQREPALFSETVRENIRAGRPGASDQEVAEAARRSGADVLHSELPDGYETLLARRGAALTDGRRRRIAIARALLRDAPVVLLDRADAELAPRERAEVLAALDALGEGRTVLLNSRDPETVRGADRVLWFEDGRLVEDGRPDGLAADSDSRLAAWLLEADDPEA